MRISDVTRELDKAHRLGQCEEIQISFGFGGTVYAVRDVIRHRDGRILIVASRYPAPREQR